jgi:hypothetical protein
MRVQIEEKEFETQFVVEFSITHGPLGEGYSIGQALEGHKGYEGIFYTRRHGLHRRIGMSWKPGRLVVEIDGFEDVKANLFIQFKRSEYCTGKRSKPYQHWQTPYYEYRIDKNQQKILSDFSKRNQRTLSVIYAAPVFHLRSDFVANKRGNTIIDNSNVVRVSKLNNHSKYTFCDPDLGRAFSEPEMIEAESIKTIISNIKENGKDGVSFEQNLIDLSLIIDEVCEENKLSDYIEVMSKNRFYDFESYPDYPEHLKFLNVFSKIMSFQELTNTRWVLF